MVSRRCFWLERDGPAVATGEVMVALRSARITLRAVCIAALSAGCGASGSQGPEGEAGFTGEASAEPVVLEPGVLPALVGAGALRVTLAEPDVLRGSFAARGQVVDLAALASGPLSGAVQVLAGGVSYDLQYDFAARRVVGDGHGDALDSVTHLTLLDAVAAVTESLGAARPDAPLHVQMLYAALVLWHESGGAPLGLTTFELDPPEVDKALGDDGVLCVKRGQAYAVSFDHAGTTVVDAPVTADEHRCNGRCGPYCTALTPFSMWTLDCLEHDQCCRETDDPTCWTPFNECGDEYFEAETDFLRGLDPFSSHCGG